MNLIAAAVSIVVALSLPHKWVTVGLAGALSISYYFGTWTTIRLLKRFAIKIKIGEVVGFYLKLALRANPLVI